MSITRELGSRHKNGRLFKVTKISTGGNVSGNYIVEGFQRPHFGIPYVQTRDVRLKNAYNAAVAALRTEIV